MFFSFIHLIYLFYYTFYSASFQQIKNNKQTNFQKAHFNSKFVTLRNLRLFIITENRNLIIFIKEMPILNSNDNLFASKLHSILQDPQAQTVIKWGESKYKIEIIDKNRLMKEILPKYFRHNRFESFVRQMNLYGFKKIRSSKLHSFINLELKKGKKLTELKSKNQLKQEPESDGMNSDQQSGQIDNRNSSEKVQDEKTERQGFYCVEPVFYMNRKIVRMEPSPLNQIPYVYCPPVPQPYIHMNPMVNYPVYPYQYFVYQ